MNSTMCSINTTPTTFLKDITETVGYSISIINSTLLNSHFPSVFKHAVLQPLLKKPKLDSSVLYNIRPMSKLSILSKVLEKVVLTHFSAIMSQNNVFEKFRPGFRESHSTETALLNVTNDLFLAVQFYFF